ncbi:MAG: BTAD domain-containing putative transcriptional regulator, partial [Caldilinea sp.]
MSVTRHAMIVKSSSNREKKLNLKLLGPFSAAFDGEPSLRFATSKVQALLCILAMERARPLARERLMTMLWPDMPLPSAQQNVRQTLYLLRRSLERGSTILPVIASDRLTLQFDSRFPVWLDVEQFLDLTEGGCSPAEWRAGLDLYQGDFLEEFYLVDSDVFEEWSAGKRAWLHERAVTTLDWLVEYSLAEGDPPAAIWAAHRYLTLDPLNESAHRRLMIALMQSGERATALAHYE